MSENTVIAIVYPLLQSFVLGGWMSPCVCEHLKGDRKWSNMKYETKYDPKWENYAVNHLTKKASDQYHQKYIVFNAYYINPYY